MNEDQMPTMDDDQWRAFALELGVNLARARHARGLSQRDLADEAGIAGYTYQKYEHGESRPGRPLNPQLRNLMAVSAVLGVPVAELLPALPDGGGDSAPR